MRAADRIARELSRIPSVRTETGVFVGMDGPLAVVNVGASTITVPCVGFYPPAVGMTVQVEWKAGRPAVTGPASPLNPIGVVTTVGSPTAGVSVDGETYNLYFRDGYTPQSGDTVEINWATGIIQGKVTGVAEPESPDTRPPQGEKFSLKVRATDSGRYQNSWWSNDPMASNNNDGIWVYDNRVKGAISGASVSKVEIFLPLLERRGNCRIGTHPHSSIPGGPPSIGSTVNLPADKRSGWLTLPTSFADYLATGGRGIGVTADIGLNIWKGTDRDGDSGALRFTGTR